MAIIELILPQFKQDPQVIEEVAQTVIPTLMAKVRDAEAISGLRGFIKSQDGQDVTSSLRQILFLEWPSPSSFFNFLASPSFAEFKTDLKPYIVSPPELKLYETNIGMEPLLKDLNVEVLMIRAKDTTDPEALFSLSEKVASGVKQTNGAYIIHGSSINPENKEILVFVLAPFKFQSLPLGSIKATGWLHDQVRLSADGLGGHLFDFYRYVQRSTWLGGEFEYSELHESAPYWFNYIVPLAWTLDDDRLKGQARQFLDYTLDNQAEDGWLGPETTRQTRGIWARSLLCFGLVQYAEADPSQQDRIVDALHRFVTLTHSMLRNNFTGLIQDKAQNDNFDPYGFGLSRTHELPISLMWLYENHPRNQRQIIWETIQLMFEGGRQGGRDWTAFFVEGVFPTQGTGTFKTSGFTHGVNLAEGLRYPTVLYRLDKNASLIQQTHDAVNMTATYQTSLSGNIIGDEHLGGLSPQRGSELCMAVESMFSYAFLYRFHGVTDYADKAELAAFNALPAGMASDWWSHQYVTQTNQPWAKNLTENPFFNVVQYGNTYGLEPNFPCCTVNHPQGYPKFVASSYATRGDGVLVHMLLSPTSVEANVNGHTVKVSCQTNYPFSDVLEYIVSASEPFQFAIRIPEWTDVSKASIQAGGDGSPSVLSRDAEGLHRIEMKSGQTTLLLHLPMQIRTVVRNSTVGIYRGPLLYAAAIDYSQTSHNPLNWTDRTPLPASEVDARSRDWALEPTSPWQYAISPSTLRVGTGQNLSAHDTLLSPVFALKNAPVSLEVDAYPIDWPEDKGTAALPPVDPVVDPTAKVTLKLIPYGAAKLHIAQFPVARFENGKS